VRAPFACALCLLSLLTAAAADLPAARTVIVVATEYQFRPNLLTFKVGVPYRLRVENHGAELHEFTAGAFFKAVEVRNPEGLDVDGTELVVHPGESKELRFTARKPARYPVICADHDWIGMTAEIVVE